MRHRDDQKISRTFEAALQIIGQKGLAGLKMQQLAKQAGMATGTLYVYFKDKNDLLNQMYVHYVKQMQRNIWGELRIDAPFEEKFRQRWYNYLRYVQQFPAEIVFLEQYHRSPFASQDDIAQQGNVLQPLVEIILEGQKAGTLIHLPVNLVLSFICGSVQEMVAWSENGHLPAVTDITHQAWELTWKSVSKQPRN